MRATGSPARFHLLQAPVEVEPYRAATALPHPPEELLGGLAFDHCIGDGDDVFRGADPRQHRPELFGGAGTEPAADLPKNQLALPLD